ncbi:cyclase family protein [Archangium sp.]|uniref:cyclase family protein n=1 Tax=Archangium sp. TaxID=1872627 RepID=UPI002D582335|nr:cyclase family protein [Archangium sp.]HYO58475.1 cyclase family protein [Archangium sp.]
MGAYVSRLHGEGHRPPSRVLPEGARLVDLTYDFDEKTLYWPTAPSGFELKQLSHCMTAAGFFYASNTLCSAAHGGTHLDAPIHFAEGKMTTECPRWGRNAARQIAKTH